jgi:hypothetical protein
MPEGLLSFSSYRAKIEFFMEIQAMLSAKKIYFLYSFVDV